MQRSTLGILNQALEALGSLLARVGAEERLIVVGGVAILLRGFRERLTTDVDIIATATISDGLVTAYPAEPLSEALQEGIHRVARDFGLPDDWLNTVIGKQWRGGIASMPPGLIDDIEWQRFGGLSLGIAGRLPLIALKLYAATDTGPRSVHTQDLISMKPTDAELQKAAEWVVTQDASAEFSSMLNEVVDYVKGQREIR